MPVALGWSNRVHEFLSSILFVEKLKSSLKRMSCGFSSGSVPTESDEQDCCAKQTDKIGIVLLFHRFSILKVKRNMCFILVKLGAKMLISGWNDGQIADILGLIADKSADFYRTDVILPILFEDCCCTEWSQDTIADNNSSICSFYFFLLLILFFNCLRSFRLTVVERTLDICWTIAWL